MPQWTWGLLIGSRIFSFAQGSRMDGPEAMEGGVTPLMVAARVGREGVVRDSEF